MTSLPSVTHFVDVLPQIYRFLLQSCLVETNLSFLQNFLLFLTRHYPSDKLYESVIGLSRLIVDRFDIIQKILLPTFSRSSAGDHSLQGAPSVILLSSLYELFHRAMEAAINSQMVPQVTSGSDFLLVMFPSRSQKALVHTAFIQAAYLLLSLGVPVGAAVADFAYLKDLWAPSLPQEKPEAHTMEDKTPVSLPPKEVLPYTLLSQNSAVLEASIAAASPSQLCEHVQRFGCPLSCMENVLGVLDTTCTDRGSAAELRHCITDPVMMARVVEVQMLRGSESGQGFLTFVQGLSNLPPTSLKESAKILQEKKSNVSICDGLLEASDHAKPMPSQVGPLSLQSGMSHQIINASTEELEQYLLQIFCPFASDSKKSQNSSQLKVLQDHHCLEHDLRLLLRRGERSSTANLSGLVSALAKVTSTNKVKVVEGMLQTRFSISLFRLLSHYLCLRKMDQLSEQLRRTVDNISKFLQSSRYKLTKLRHYHSFIVVLKDASRRLKLEEEVRSRAGRSSPNQKDLKVVRDIRKSQNLLQLEPVVTKMSQESIQGGNLVRFEALVKLLVKKSITANCKEKCITLLQEVKDNVGSSCSPLAYQSHPELFRWKESGAFSDSDSSTSMDVQQSSDAVSRAKVPDISGLLVDMIEVLDSELYAVAGSVTKNFLFGHSEIFRGHLQGKVTNLLLSGQGFLLACLVHNSSWGNLLAALDHILDRNNFVEWLAVVCVCVCVCMHAVCRMLRACGVLRACVHVYL